MFTYHRLVANKISDKKVSKSEANVLSFFLAREPYFAGHSINPKRNCAHQCPNTLDFKFLRPDAETVVPIFDNSKDAKPFRSNILSATPFASRFRPGIIGLSADSQRLRRADGGGTSFNATALK